MLPGGKYEKDEKKCLTFLRLAYIICDVAGDNATIDVCLAQLDRAFGYGPKGRGFESSNTRFLERSKVLEKSRVFGFFVFGSNPVCLLHFITLNSTHRAWQLQGRQYHQSYQE